ncbi:Photosystem I subunit O [Carex littledalei]|uniref:Photosystem I subunit O n=1 Tax=Carex littledalei TaxID=544730 RepID=A0A833RUD1_9POAL|nr:Photosystem I subunit O [Carex littledalei]
MATSAITGLGSSLSLSRPSSKAFLTSRRSSRRNVVTCRFPSNWLRRDLNVIGFGLIGWLAPSSIPAINGNSLSGLFFSSIGEELAHFPTGPALTSPFWLWLVTWHLGLFISLTFGQIGFKGRTEGYFDK